MIWTLSTVAILIIVGLVLKTIIIVPMREAVVIERLGKFRGVLKPGLHILIPFFDRVAYRHEMREQVLDIPGQSVITRDNMQVEVDGLVYLKVMDPQKASYGIGNYQLASINLAQTTMRSEIGKLTLGQTFSERDTLNETIVAEIDKASDPWGIKVLRYEIKNISPSAHVIHTLEKQMEAEREKRSEITMATAKKESTINLSEGEKQEAINISEGEKQKRINEAMGKARSIELIAEASAEGMKSIAEAIRADYGMNAVQMRIFEQYIDEWGKIAAKADVSIVPAQLASIKGFFEGVNEVGETLNKS